MNLEKLKNEWKDDSKEFKRLVKEQNKWLDISDKIFTERTQIFEKMNIDNIDEQLQLVELINNVVHERNINLNKTKTDLELCFTPNLKTIMENTQDDKS